MQPPEIVVPGADATRDARARALGRDLLRRGKVACLLVAGGQGTRMGISIPKGVVEVAGKSLYQRFAERIRALGKETGRPIPFFVMTSFATHEETVAFFHERRFFGLSPKSVIFFQQGSAPTRSLSGKALRALGGGPLENPDGHGGMLEAARKNGVFREAKRRGVEIVFYFQVDNPLVSICDPLFLGMHKMLGSQYSLKIVRKRDAAEKLGVLCRKGRSVRLVEYSELPRSLREARGKDGRLRFDAGSIAVHAFDLAFLAREASRPRGLPWHRARKTVFALDSKGQLVEVEAIKSERFIFDLLPRARKTLVMETSRSEFSPIKNASGPDSLATAEAALARRKSPLG